MRRKAIGLPLYDHEKPQSLASAPKQLVTRPCSYLSSLFLGNQQRHSLWRVLRSVALLCLLWLTYLVATLLFQKGRETLIKIHPNRPLSEQQHPIWWKESWKLSPADFPKVSLYPDPDWNAHPIWLNKPIADLKKHPAPSNFRCNDKTHPFYPVTQATTLDGATTSSPLLFIGIFSAGNHSEQRVAIRRRQLPHYSGAPRVSDIVGLNTTHPDHPHGDMGVPVGALETKFILGYPRGWPATVQIFREGALSGSDPDVLAFPLGVPLRESANALVQWQPGYSRPWWKSIFRLRRWSQAEILLAKKNVELMHAVALEAALYGDIVLLDLEDSITKGKTYHFFRWLARTRSASSLSGSPNRPPRFAMKTDDDSFLVIPNLLDVFADLSCSTSYFVGNSWGCAQPWPFHFGGLGYAMSWPLMSWLGAGDQPLKPSEIDQNEDARLGSFFFSNLDPYTDPVVTLDYGVQMGSWFEDVIFPKTTSTIALHYLKEPNVYRDQSERMWNLWKGEGKEWRWSKGEAWVAKHSQITRAV